MVITNRKPAVKPTSIKLVSENGRSRVYTATTREPAIRFNQRAKVVSASR